MLHCYRVTIDTPGDHNLPSTVTSNTHTHTHTHIVVFALEEKDGCGLNETNNNADGILHSKGRADVVIALW